MDTSNTTVMLLRAIVEADASAVVCVLQQLQARNITPRSISVRSIGIELLHVDVEVEASAIAPEAFRALVAKIGQMTRVLTATTG